MTTTSDKSWLDEVVENEPDYYEDPYVYEFNQERRKFKSTDRTDSGIYAGNS